MAAIAATADDALALAQVTRGRENVRVRPSPVHGRGLFATRALEEGETILEEAPLVCMQDAANKQEVLACSRCLAFLDLGRDVGGVAAGVVSRRAVHDRVVRGGTKAVACSHGCGELYCSEACRAAHWAASHEKLCVGRVAEADAADDPLVAYKVLAMSANEILLLAAEALLGDRAALSLFTREPWGAVVAGAAALRGEDAGELAESLDALCHEAARLLGAALGTPISADAVARVIGTFEQNNVGIRKAHPLGESAPPLEGAGLYSAICVANHDCRNSCDVLYDDGAWDAYGEPLRARMVAKRRIEAGEELFVSYVDVEDSVAERRAATADYGFLCSCERCEEGDTSEDGGTAATEEDSGGG